VTSVLPGRPGGSSSPLFFARLSLTAVSMLCALSLPAQQTDDQYPRQRPVIPAPLAPEVLLLDITNLGDRLIAVGVRGHIVVSDDAGGSWRQITEVPTRATLTAVTTRGNRAWAVGHDSVVLASDDRGETWSLKHADVEAEQPLMDVWFAEDGFGLAIGAYGLLMDSDDWGRNWRVRNMVDHVSGVMESPAQAEPREQAEDTGTGNEEQGRFLDPDEMAQYEDTGIDYHLHDLYRYPDGTIVIAAEAGRGYVSDDDGKTWQMFSFPYEGTMFGIDHSRAGCAVAFGLRGHAFETCDDARSWTRLETGVEATLFGVERLDDGTLMLVGGNGTLIERRGTAPSFTTRQLDAGNDLAELIATGDSIIVVGEDGARSLAELRSEDDS